MAEYKYLDFAGLSYYHGEIKKYIASSIEAAHGTEVVSIADAVETAGDKLTFTYTKADASTGTFTITKAQLDAVIGLAANQAAGGAGLMTKEQADQLAGLVSVGGEVNIIESISINGEAFAIADKAASATMSFDWEAEGSDNIVLKIGETEIGKIDTTKFVKDGIVEEAELITVPDDEAATATRPAGKYIKITWSSSATTDPTYINVTDLVDIHNVVAGAATGTLVKLTPSVTGSGTTTDPWTISVAVDETALNSALDAKVAKTDFATTLGVEAGATLAAGNYVEAGTVSAAIAKLDESLKAMEDAHVTISTTEIDTLFA